MSTNKTKRARGSVKKSEGKLVAVLLPTAMIKAIDEYVARKDTDRSKFIRRAIREHCLKQKATA